METAIAAVNRVPVANGFDTEPKFASGDRTDTSTTFGGSLFSFLMTAEALVYAALFFYVLGFLFRDELWLRGLLFIGTMFYILYYYHAAESPLWEAMLTSSILGAVNISMICVVAWERSTIGMRGDTASLYGYFENLTPGQFRRILKRGTLNTARERTKLSQEGDALEHFYFVYEGYSIITKRGKTTDVPAGHFIGEVAFLKGGPATATVEVAPGSHYISWRQDDLRRLMRKSPNLSNGLLALLNMDMAGKVATSQPTGD